MVDFARGIARAAVLLGGLALPCVIAPVALGHDQPVPITPTAPATHAPQAMSETEIRALPPEYQRAAVSTPISPEVYAGEESSIGADGVETITRTRRITRPRPIDRRTSAVLPPMPAVPAVSYGQPYAPAAGVMTREQWIEECERRTDDRRGRRTRGRNAYDCAGALDSYMARYNHTAPAGVTSPYVTYVPVQYRQPQRVIVRETVREEIVPGAARAIPVRPIKGN